MKFTDEDLKVLLEDTNNLFTLTNAKGRALLDRLTTAEKCLEEFDNTDDLSDWSRLNPLFDEWQRAAGKRK